MAAAPDRWGCPHPPLPSLPLLLLLLLLPPVAALCLLLLLLERGWSDGWMDGWISDGSTRIGDTAIDRSIDRAEDKPPPLPKRLRCCSCCRRCLVLLWCAGVSIDAAAPSATAGMMPLLLLLAALPIEPLPSVLWVDTERCQTPNQYAHIINARKQQHIFVVCLLPESGWHIFRGLGLALSGALRGIVMEKSDGGAAQNVAGRWKNMCTAFWQKQTKLRRSVPDSCFLLPSSAQPVSQLSMHSFFGLALPPSEPCSLLNNQHPIHNQKGISTRQPFHHNHALTTASKLTSTTPLLTIRKCWARTLFWCYFVFIFVASVFNRLSDTKNGRD
jgi:hypothetical protein